MTHLYLTLAKACIGWGLLFNNAANWLIAKAREEMQG
jgi:ferritin